MTPKLRNLLKLVGVVAVVGTGALVPFYIAPADVPQGVLLDAGALTDSTPAEGVCQLVCEENGVKTYRTVRVRGRFFGTGPTGGFVPTQRRLVPDGCRPFKYGEVTYQGDTHPVFMCRKAATNTLAAGVDEQDEQPDCACAPADETGARRTDTCEELLDGVWAPARPRVHFPEGTWRGACQPKACGEESGTSSWKPECGPESMP